MNKNKKTKVLKPTNVLNIFLTLAIISVVVGYLILFLNDIYSFDDSESLGINKYEISIENLSGEEAAIYTEGTRLVIRDSNTVLGTLKDVYYDEENGIATFYLSTVGTYTSDTGFKLNGKFNMAMGDFIELEAITQSAKILSIKANK